MFVLQCTSLRFVVTEWRKGVVALVTRILLMLVLLSPTEFANAQWHWQNPLPQGNTLEEIYFIDSTYGWIRAVGGTLLRTTDGGQSWSELATHVLPPRQFLLRVFFLDRFNGWSVGSGNPPVILRTTDGGDTWSDLPLPVETSSGYYNFKSVFFVNGLWGCIGDDFGEIYQTSDGGQSWTQRFRTFQAQNIRDIAFFDSARGLAVRDGFSLRTTNGGLSWDVDSSVGSATRIAIVGNALAWVAAEIDTVYLSDNAGTSWRKIKIDSLRSHLSLEAISFLDSSTGWVVAPPYLYETKDGGYTWELVYDGSAVGPRAITAARMLTGVHGWAVGGINSLLESTDEGHSWNEKTLSVAAPSSQLLDVDFVDAQFGFAVGSEGGVGQRKGLILSTTDAGTNWQRVLSDYPNEFSDVQFNDRNTGWVAAGMEVLRTTDSGTNWVAHATGSPVPIGRLQFLNDSVGFAVGGVFTDSGVAGAVLYTTNAGITWEDRTPSGGTGRLFGLYFQNQLTGWITQGGGSGYDRGRVYRTDNGGESWQTILDDPSDSFEQILFVDALEGWIRSDYGLLHTSDGGQSWQPRLTPVSTGGIYHFAFRNHRNGTLVGLQGQIAETTDGGISWSMDTSHTSLDLRGIDCVGDTLAWTVGLFGAVLHRAYPTPLAVDDGDMSSNTPGNLNILGSYPNPFNGTTTIEYSVSGLGAPVLVLIYNMAGQEIRRFEAKGRQRGRYQVTWDGTDSKGSPVGSGAYYFVLQTEFQYAVGKAVIIK